MADAPKRSSFLQGLSAKEKRVISISLIVASLCAFLLANEKIANLLFAKLDATNVQVGLVEQAVQAQVMRFPKKEFVDLKNNEPLFVNDLLRTRRQGSLKVRLMKDQLIELSEDSQLRLSSFQESLLVDLGKGEFLLGWSPGLHFSIHGAMLPDAVEPVELFARIGQPDESPIFKVRKGRWSIPGQTAPTVDPKSADMNYIWRISDLYTINGRVATPKEKASELVDLEKEIVWYPNSKGTFVLQHSSDHEFTKNVRHLSSETDSYTLRQVFLGKNFWRVSHDGQGWSDHSSFKVEPTWLSVGFTVSQNSKLVTWKAQAQSGVELAGYLIECAKSFYLSEVMQVSLERLRGCSEVRLRAISKSAELSDWSPAFKFSRSR